MTPSARPFSATTSGVPPCRAIAIHLSPQLSRNDLPLLLHESLDGVDRALAYSAAVEVDAGHAGRGGERNERRLVGGEFTGADAVLFLREDDDRPSLRGLVRKRRELRGVGERRLADACSCSKLSRVPVAQRDRAGLVEQQRIHVAGSFDGAS